MRRKERQITDINEICSILDRCFVLRVAMYDGQTPYAVPVNFGYELEKGSFTFYFHGAEKGKKLDILKQYPKVCIETDCNSALVTADIPCRHSWLYESIIAAGTAEICTQNKSHGMQIIMKHLTGKKHNITEDMLKGTSVVKIKTDCITAKRHQV